MSFRINDTRDFDYLHSPVRPFDYLHSPVYTPDNAIKKDEPNNLDKMVFWGFFAVVFVVVLKICKVF
jgi:hypothetical protein